MPSPMPRSGLTMALSVMVLRIRATTIRKQRVARRGKSDALLAQRITSSERLSDSPAAGVPGGVPGRGGSVGRGDLPRAGRGCGGRSARGGCREASLEIGDPPAQALDMLMQPVNLLLDRRGLTAHAGVSVALPRMC